MQLDQRVLRFGVEVDGQMRVYEGLHLTASGEKFANPLQDTCSIVVFNLARDVRNFILTETSPFNANRTPKRLRLEAGRASTGLSVVFEGDITECRPTEGPDIGIELQAKTGQFVKGNVVAVTQSAQAPLSRIAAQVAEAVGAALQFEATDKQVSNYSFTGGALKQVERLAEAGQVDAYVDGTTLYVKDRGRPLRGVVHTLSAKSGMIGLPEQTEKGVRATYLYDPSSRVGGELRLESVANPSLSGAYSIYKLGWELSTHDPPFYTIAEASRIP